MTGSKFSALRVMREKRAQETEDVQPALPDVALAPTVAELRRRVGRPRGKRSNPDYQQVTVLLHGQTYLEVRKRLLDEHKEVSELINELLVDWLK